MTIPRICIAFAVVWLALAGGCSKMLNTGITPIKARNFGALQEFLFKHPTDVEQFRLRGPFAVTVQEDLEIRPPDTEAIESDLFLSKHADKAPLVIFVHGFGGSKESHTHQALHVASWGMHCLSLDLPNEGPWVPNGKTVAKVVKFLQHSPETLGNRVDTGKIVLVGHSFGAAAVAVAIAEGAPAIGAILLDPAFENPALPKLLKKITTPVMVLGADEQVSQALNRENFYRFIRSGVHEVSIRDATHEDAQYPSLFASTTEEAQITFASAIAAAAFSVAATGAFDYAWKSFSVDFSNGKLFNAKWK